MSLPGGCSYTEENPKETAAAWELARIKLESYLNRNLSQVSAVFWLTLFIMIAGFVLIGYGVTKVYEGQENFRPSILVAVSGVLLEFVAGTFLLVYRSTMAQANGYVTVLERINAVGMAVQILDSIEGSDSKIKDQATADMAKQMLSMYTVGTGQSKSNAA